MSTITTDTVKEAIDALAAMATEASITPSVMAGVLEKLRNLNDSQCEYVVNYYADRFSSLTTDVISLLTEATRSFSCSDYLKSGKAVNPAGEEIDSSSYESIAFDVKVGEYVEFPSLAAAGGNSLVARLVTDSGSTDLTVSDVDADSKSVVVSTTGTLWLMYYYVSDKPTFADKFIVAIGEGAKAFWDEKLDEINSRIDTNEQKLSECTRWISCTGYLRSGKAVSGGGEEQSNANFESLVIDVKEGDYIEFPSLAAAGGNSLVARQVAESATSDLTISVVDTNTSCVTATSAGTLWLMYYYVSDKPTFTDLGIAVLRPQAKEMYDRITASDDALDTRINANAQKLSECTRWISCTDYLRSGKAVSGGGEEQSNANFESLVINVKEGDYIEFPSLAAAGGNSLVARQVAESATSDLTISVVDTNTSCVTATSAGTLWLMYYYVSDKPIFVGLSIGVLRSKAKEMYDRLRKGDATLGTWELADIIQTGYAFFNSTGEVKAHVAYSCFELSIYKGQKLTIPGASSVGASNVSVYIVNGTSIEMVMDANYEDAPSVTVSKTGTVYVNYYFIGEDASTKTTTTGLTVKIDESSTSSGLASAGRKVLWIGTSIPYGGGLSAAYPNQVKRILGIKTLYNNCRPSSGIVVNSGYLGNARDGIDLAETVAEKESRYRSKVTDGTFTENALNDFKSCSYEQRMIPYIDGTTDSCDTVIIDHGFNDRDQIVTDLTNGISYTSTDRATFFGAFNYLIQKIYEVNPRIQIIVVGYFSRENLQFGPEGERYYCLGDKIDDMLTKLSSYYNFTYLPTYEASCINQLNYLSMIPDGVHPHSDENQVANGFIARYLANRLEGIL